MSKISIVYWSQTGNTEAMANAIGEGIMGSQQEYGKEAEVVEVTNVAVEDLKEANVIALGCPAMGVEELEDSDMEPFVTELEKFVDGKQIALFGSYGWGDGQWMREWEERMVNAGATIVGGEGIICQDTPDDTVLDACKNLGKQLASI